MRAVTHPRIGRAMASGLAGIFLFAGGLAAAIPGFDRPSARERLDPDSTVVAAWTLDPEVLRGLDEAELVLSLDDGATFPVRLTARIPPDARSTVWRVPALPTEHARLALRAGLDEREGAEELLFVSEPFAIASPGARPREELFAINGEWRTRDALEGAPVRTPTSSCQSPGPEPELDPFDADDADGAGTDDAFVAEDAAGRGNLDAARPPRTLYAQNFPRTFLPEASAPLRL